MINITGDTHGEQGRFNYLATQGETEWTENDYLIVNVTLNGGSLTSIYDKKKNIEHLYQKDERSWMGQDVVIFPVIGGLKDKECIVDDKIYIDDNLNIEIKYKIKPLF